MVELECTACEDRKGKAIEIKRKTKAVQFIFKHTYRGYPLLLEYLHSNNNRYNNNKYNNNRYNNNRYSNRNYEKSPTNTKQLCAILQINFDCGRAFVGGRGGGGGAGTPKYAAQSAAAYLVQQQLHSLLFFQLQYLFSCLFTFRHTRYL